jgi:hypothetical protein
MRKIIVQEFLTLDGVMQAPGGPKEDISGGFQYGGWVAPYFNAEPDPAFDAIMQKWMQPSDILLGKNTFQIFELTGPHILKTGRELMTSINMFFLPVWRIPTGKIPFF